MPSTSTSQLALGRVHSNEACRTRTLGPAAHTVSEARALVTVCNAHLKPDGWQLIEASEISDKPV